MHITTSLTGFGAGNDGDASLSFVSVSMDVPEDDSEVAEFCVLLSLTAPVTALGCDMTVTMSVSDGALASEFYEKLSLYICY